MSIPKIIYFQPWGGLGDVLLSTPALYAIKKTYPDALIYCNDLPIYRELLAGNPCIYRFINSYQELFDYSDNKLKEITNDLSHEKAIFYPCYGSLRPSLKYPAKHAIEHIAQMIGIKPVTHKIKINLSPKDDKNAELFIDKIGRPVIAFHAEAICSKNKQWYPERWIKIVDWLGNKGYKVLQLGSQNETHIAGAINMLGKTNIAYAMALVKHSDYFLGIDSVFNHAASAFGTTGVVLFGASTPEVWGHKEHINLYKGLKCQPCIDLLYDKCQARFCMQQISTEEVINALSELLCLT